MTHLSRIAPHPARRTPPAVPLGGENRTAEPLRLGIAAPLTSHRREGTC